MLDAATERRLAGTIRKTIDREEAAGWERLRRVPSTYTWKILDYLQALDAARRPALFDAFVANALFFFDPGRDRRQHAYEAGHAEYRAMVDALPRMGDWRYTDVRSLRMLLAASREPLPPEFTKPPEDVLARAAAIRPATAADIRKVVKQAFGSRFGAKPENAGGGNWRYRGAHQGRPLVVTIDYGGAGAQLRYSVEYDDDRTKLGVTRLNFESLVGAGQGNWDALTADNLADSIELLCGFVEELATIPERLAP